MTLTAAAPPDADRLVHHLYRPIAADLQEVERIFAEELQSDVPYVSQLVEHLRHYSGKRLRPVLLLLTARACGRVTREHHMLGAVVEMIHTATLVHDDVLDGADMRRHVATINAEWGNSSSVLLGDLLFTHSFYLASGTGSTVACRLIGEATNRVCAGELQQIGERGNLDLSEEDYLEIIEGKTAELTACCCRLGAIFSDASDGIVESMTRYGRKIGIAFQIADDLLDIVGKEEEAGKSLGTDLAQQKLTLPLIRLLRRSSPETALRIRELIADSSGGNSDRLLQWLRDSGALAYSTQQAEKYALAARQELLCLPPSESRQVLEELTRLVVHRSR